MCINRSRVSFVLVLTLGALLPAASLSRNASADDATILKELVEEFRPIVPASGWSRSAFELKPSDMKNMSEKAPAAKRERYARGFQKGQGISFSPEQGEAFVEGVVAYFDSPKNASAFVALERQIFAAENSTKNAKVKTKTFTKKAGAKKKIPGFFLDRSVDFGGPTTQLRTHYIHRGRLIAWVVLTDAPDISISWQHEVVAKVDEKLKSKVTQSSLPKGSGPEAEQPADKEEATPAGRPTNKKVDFSTPAGLLEAMRGNAKPAFVEWIASGDKKGAGFSTRLESDPALLASLADVMSDEAARIARRDGEAAPTFAAHLVELARDICKSKRKDPAAYAALVDTSLASLRIGIAAGREITPGEWTRTADALVDRAELSGDKQRLGSAYEQAIELLHEGASQERASSQRLFEHASKIGLRGVAACPDQDDLRRVVAQSFETQARAAVDGPKGRLQTALNKFFEVFGPLAQLERRQTEDTRKFNELVTLGRTMGLKLKQGYISRRRTALLGLLAFSLPETGNWSSSGNGIDQTFKERSYSRGISFSSYEWDSVYGNDGIHDVGGDNIKGLASLHLDIKVKLFDKVKRIVKPARGNFGKLLPSGISYSIVGDMGRLGEMRLRVFAVKAVKAEKTILITIVESAPLGRDPEQQAVYASLDITKKKR